VPNRFFFETDFGRLPKPHPTLETDFGNEPKPYLILEIGFGNEPKSASNENGSFDQQTYIYSNH
jgi:hypothetical protein